MARCIAFKQEWMARPGRSNIVTGRKLMKDLVLILSIAVGMFLPFPIHAELGTTNDLPSRIELLSFSSLWIPDQQFLTGNEQGKEVALTGELSLPQRQGKVPLVILMHGSTGISAYIPYWVRHLNEIGVATFVIDGFSGRGLTEVGQTKRFWAASISSSIFSARWRC